MKKRPLTLIPSPTPTPQEQVLSRLKRIPRPTGMLQCPRCGGRSVINVRNGVIVREGRPRDRGTLILKDHCAACYRQGIKILMIPGGQGPKLVPND